MSISHPWPRATAKYAAMMPPEARRARVWPLGLGRHIFQCPSARGVILFQYCSSIKCQTFCTSLPYLPVVAQAVSDTGVIRAEAEINYYVSQVEVISYIESMLLGDPFNFLSNWPTFVWLRRFPSCR